MITAGQQQRVDVPASLGWRVLAQLVDLTIIVFVLGLVVAIYMNAGVDVERETGNGWLMEVTFFALVFCYFLAFEGLMSSTPGKLAAGLRVTMRDGSRISASAAILRNLVRIPELMFLYVPAIISVAANPERRRLGDFAGRTVVWRQSSRPQTWQVQQTPQGRQPWQVQRPHQGQQPWQVEPGRQGDPQQGWQGDPQQGWQGDPQQGWQGQPVSQPASPPPPLVDWSAIAAEGCVAAARGLANAENAYRLMAEREHLRLVQFGLSEAGPDALSDEYVSAWEALAEGVVGLQQSYHRLASLLGAADVWAFIAARPRLAAALGAVDDYLPAASDDDVVATFRRRLESVQARST